MAHLRAHYMHH